MSIDQQRYNILVADDEPHAREHLIGALADESLGLPIGNIIQASTGLEAFEFIDSCDDANRPAIAFLDIHMPEMSGLELAHHLAKMRKPPLIVFVTAHDEHAIEAFNAQALDYVLKPARSERLLSVFSKIDAIAGTKERLNDAALAKAGLAQRTHLSVSERGHVRLIPVDQIVYLKAELKYTTIRTVEKEYLTEEPLIGLENEFAGQFLRIHRNCLVPKMRLKSFERNKSDEAGWCAVIEGCPDKLPVSRRQWAAIREMNLF